MNNTDTSNAFCDAGTSPPQPYEYAQWIGQTFGRLTVQGYVGRDKNGKMKLMCSCSCGGTTEVYPSHLKNGYTTSCSCWRRELTAQRNRDKINHGHARQIAPSRTYVSWRSMIQRTTNPKYTGWKNYGGRGISVCPEWQGESGFINFLTDLGPRPDGMTLDRIDPDGDYTPSNTRWADAKTQRANQRPRQQKKQVALEQEATCLTA